MRRNNPSRSKGALGAYLAVALGWGALLLRWLGQWSRISPGAAASLGGTFLAFAMVAVLITLLSLVAAKQADRLAEVLGEPYGTLVLTLSVALIEVALISAVMLGPGDHVTIARDSIMSVSMIILNLVIGLALLVSGAKRNPSGNRRVPCANQTGVRKYLALLALSVLLVFGLPNLLGDGGQFPRGLALPAAALVALSYAWFLYRQMGSSRCDYQEAHPLENPTSVGWGSSVKGGALKTSVLLVLLLVPIVLLADSMADLMDHTFLDLGAPPALAGLVIASIVFFPETISSVRAASTGRMQRVSNLCHGALLSTMGITIPAVLLIGAIGTTPVVLAESSANLGFLAATLALTWFSFARGRTVSWLGAAHLVLFACYIAVLLAA